MHLNYWVKNTKYKLFGLKLFEKIETCNDYDIQNLTYTVKVSPEYCKAEFEDKTDGNK